MSKKITSGVSAVWGAVLHRMFARTVWLMIMVLALTQGCAVLTHTDSVSTDAEVSRYARSGDLRAEVNSMAQPLIDAGQVPGIVVGVLMPDRSRQFFSYGIRDQATRAKPDGQTIFPVGSVSKGFVGAIAAQLVQTGALSWNDTLAEHLPAGTPLSRDAQKITLIQLASHTAGLPRQPNPPRLGAYLIQYFFTGENFYRNLDRNYLMRYLAGFKAPDPIRPQSSNIGFAYLSYAMELQTGKSDDQLLAEFILQPLGLHQTGYDPERLTGWSNHAQGHAGDQPQFIRRGKPLRPWRFTQALRSSVGLYTSAEDLLTFASAYLHGSGDIRRDAALRDTLQRRADPPPFTAAVAWTLDDFDGRTVAYQTGVAEGFACYLGLDMERKTAVVVLQNGLNWTDHIGHRLLLRMSRAYDQKRLVGRGPESPATSP